MSQAPIALFVYRRPQHTARTIASLMQCDGFDPRRLFVFSDGPKPGVTEVEEVRAVVRDLLPEATLVCAQTNQGLAKSITSGVTQLTDAHGKVIVIEDDLILARNFLVYMDTALELFKDEPQVMQVSGFAHDVEHPPENATFLPMTSSWGWATWKRAWQAFDITAPGAKSLLADPVARRRFDLNGTMTYSRMLEWQLRGDIDSWAIKFYLSVFERNGLVLYPPRTLVDNEGFDGSGSHGAASARVASSRQLDERRVQMPDRVAIDEAYFAGVCAAAQRDYGTSNSTVVKIMRTLQRKLGLA